MYVDLMGPEGNAYALLAIASKLMMELEYEPYAMADVLDDMRSGDYRNLCEVMENELGGYVELENKPWEGE